MFKIKVCQTCGNDKIKKVRRNWTSKTRNYVVPNLEFYECPDCAEKVHDREAMQKIESYSSIFAKKQVEKTAY